MIFRSITKIACHCEIVGFCETFRLTKFHSAGAANRFAPGAPSETGAVRARRPPNRWPAAPHPAFAPARPPRSAACAARAASVDGGVPEWRIHRLLG
ncbi:hypothetical protein AQ806_20275 [Burkholderia pseudomallei]|nr:hypothetical protein SZ29_02045 [Burkholderia pseudomallei]OMW18354.1 hypothetical protein AQ806_20275 [Burkholderia pseudomallei]ONC65467.1 hypothetical protein AQ920_11890 [Burkholderia pseudomallei]